jgi:hypothetical protein
VRYVFFGLFALAVGLAILHWSLMPRIPLLDVITSGGDPQALALERENSAKLLPAPALLKYAFTWNSRIFFPLLLCTAVLCRWRLLSILTAVIGLLYIASPLEKLPSLLFVLGPFLAVALRDGKRLLSPRLIAGAILSLVPVFLIAESPRISNSLHHIGGATVTTAPSAGPSVAAAAPSPGAEPGFGVAQAEGTIKDLILRRIGSGPADVTGAWFGYFPAAHGGFLNGTGWQPWRVLSPHYQSPANLVGLWAYYGRQGYDISSLSAYASFIADGWAEFGYVGVLLACLVIIGFGIVLELMRAFSRYRFCLACYAVGLLLLSAAAPEAGLMALIFSLGLVFCPAFCLGYLVAAKLATTPTRPIPALPTYRVPAR